MTDNDVFVNRAVEEENLHLNAAIRQYLEGRVVELNIRAQKAELQLKELDEESRTVSDERDESGE